MPRLFSETKLRTNEARLRTGRERGALEFLEEDFPGLKS
jgi:hypothetical protein